MRIQHNITAQNAYRQLGGNNTQVSKNLEKLSSGYRINRAGDDAAGLAISEKMRSQIKGLETAQKNSNDGISLVQTAEGALTEVHSMLNRMTELATQSANGTYDNTTDRKNLQKEVDSLVSEIDRIAESTNFNGINLLDGSLGGAGNSGSNLTGAKVINYKPATSAVAGNTTGGVTVGQEVINIDGADITVDWEALGTTGFDSLKKNWASSASASASDAKSAAELMQKTINDAIDKSGLGVAHISVISETDSTTGVSKFKFTSGSADKDSQIVFKNSAGLTGTVMGTTNSTATSSGSLVGSAADFNGVFQMSINGENYKIDTSAGTNTVTGASDVASVLQDAIHATISNYNDAVGADQQLDVKDFKVNVTKDGRLEISNNSDVKVGFSDTQGNDFAAKLGISTESKTSGNGLTLQIGDTADAFNQVTVSVGSMSASSLGISSIDIANQDGAATAIDKIKSAINNVSSTRGDLGAIQNRLEHTINNLGVTTENMTAAESRIRDVDMASEMMNFTKNNILTQAAQSMLAQANQLPQGVLQLLQ